MRRIPVQTFGSRKKLLINFGTYFAANILNRALPFMLLPIATHYLTPEEYGLWAIFQVLITFVNPLIGMNMQNCITRSFFREEKAEIGRIISNILIVLIFNTLCVTLALVLFASRTPTFQGIPSAWLLAIPLISITDAFLQLWATVLRNLNQALVYGVTLISSTALNLTLTITFVAMMHLNWHGPVTATVIESSVVGMISLLLLFRSQYIVLDASRQRLADILRVSLPMIPHALSAVVINLSDRLFISHLSGAASVGIYSVGYQFGMIIILITEAFNLVWTPWMYRQLAHISALRKRKIVQYTYLYNVGIVILAIGVALASYVLIDVLIPDMYADAKAVVMWISLAYAFRGMYMMVFAYLVHQGKTGFLALSSSLAAIVNVAANIALIPLNGPVGAAQATLFSFAAMYLLVWWYSNRVYPMPWLLRPGQAQQRAQLSNHNGGTGVGAEKEIETDVYI